MIAVGFTGHKELVSDERLAVFGTALKRIRDRYFAREVTLHHGDCVGMDACAHKMARDMGLSVVVHPPEDPSRRVYCGTGDPNVIVCCPKPYIERNHDIVDASVMLIAMPRDPAREVVRSGTWATVRYARKHHVPIALL